MKGLNYSCYMTTLLTDTCTAVTRLISGVFSLKEGVESFYEYMKVLANHEVNPLMVPPSYLQGILLDIRYNIHQQPWLALPDDPNDNIWAYYPIMQVSPIVVEEICIFLAYKVTSVFLILSLSYTQWTRYDGVYMHFLSEIEA